MPALPQQTSDSVRSTSSRPGMRREHRARLQAHALRVREVAGVVIRDARRQRVQPRGQLHVETRRSPP